jgi:general secretion pathway protein I
MWRSRARQTLRRGRAGFTLLEVLVAFVILAVSLGAIYQAFGVGARNARAAEAYTVAALLAESQLAAAGIEEPLFPGATEGEFARFRWRRVVTPAGEPAQPASVAGAGALRATRPQSAQLYAIAVTVTWGDEGGAAPRTVTLRTQRLGEPES